MTDYTGYVFRVKVVRQGVEQKPSWPSRLKVLFRHRTPVGRAETANPERFVDDTAVCVVVENILGIDTTHISRPGNTTRLKGRRQIRRRQAKDEIAK